MRCEIFRRNSEHIRFTARLQLWRTEEERNEKENRNVGRRFVKCNQPDDRLQVYSKVHIYTQTTIFIVRLIVFHSD